MTWGEEMIKIPFSYVMSKPYQRESQDEEQLKLNQLVEVHLQTPEDEAEKVLVRLESLFEDEEKEEIEMIMYATPIVSPRMNEV